MDAGAKHRHDDRGITPGAFYVPPASRIIDAIAS